MPVKRDRITFDAFASSDAHNVSYVPKGSWAFTSFYAPHVANSCMRVLGAWYTDYGLTAEEISAVKEVLQEALKHCAEMEDDCHQCRSALFSARRAGLY